MRAELRRSRCPPVPAKTSMCGARHAASQDLVELGRRSDGLCFNFNAPNAGASQNHIHIHAWVQESLYPVQHCAQAPPAPQRGGEGDVRTLECGAHLDIVSGYASTCVRVRGGSVAAAGAAVHALVRAVPVHNVAVCGADVFVFLREPGTELWAVGGHPAGGSEGGGMQASAVRGSALEISGTEMQGAPVADGLKLGAAQLLGRFVVDTLEQYEAAARAGAVDAALALRCEPLSRPVSRRRG